MDLGTQIKNLRIQKNLTQEELGERTDLSKGYISQMEHNQSSPSMETFFAILAVLGKTPAEFFRNDDDAKVVYHQQDQTQFSDSEIGYKLDWLVPESNENEMEPVLITLAEKGSFKRFDPSSAETFVFVLSGEIKLTLGKQTYLAKANESFYFHATTGHQLKNAGSGVSKMLLCATRSYL